MFSSFLTYAMSSFTCRTFDLALTVSPRGYALGQGTRGLSTGTSSAPKNCVPGKWLGEEQCCEEDKHCSERIMTLNEVGGAAP